MTSREAIIVEAREWLGTKYCHQAVLKGVGCDCVGLIRGVGIATGAMDPMEEEWRLFDGYGRLPNPNKMLKGMETFLVPVAGDPLPGDIAWMQWRQNLPMHLGILATGPRGQDTIIHSFISVGRVVEHSINLMWRDRIASWWRYPNVQ